MVVNEWTRLSGDPRQGKALIFCVSVAHARFVAEQLSAAGLPALAVTGDTPKAEQLRAPHRLARGEVCALVTVDLYNEGVDIPEVDTLLLLRPTQSPVLFQQQIGRGLRLVPGKESCLILDFVGQHRADFRFDRLFSALTGLSRRQLIDAVEHGFTDLAPGCHIHLQRQTRAQVLRYLRRRSATPRTSRRTRLTISSFGNASARSGSRRTVRCSCRSGAATWLELALRSSSSTFRRSFFGSPTYSRQTTSSSLLPRVSPTPGYFGSKRRKF
jgi:superfamily II DNA/RNA helicase